MSIKINIDWQHIAITAGSAFLGAAVGYLEQQDPVALLGSFDSWAHAKPLVLGFVYAGIAAVIALAKKSFVQQGPDAPPPVAGKTEFLPRSVPPPPADTPVDGMIFPKPPKTMMRTAFAVSLVCSALTLVTGCGTTWWANFQKDPVSQVTSFVQTVETFISSANVVWSILAPLLGTNLPAATAAFNDVMVTLHNALGALQDAVHAAVVAQTSNPDFTKFFADVQDAVQRVMAVIAQYRGSSAHIGGAHDMLVHQADAIATWRK